MAHVRVLRYNYRDCTFYWFEKTFDAHKPETDEFNNELPITLPLNGKKFNQRDYWQQVLSECFDQNISRYDRISAFVITFTSVISSRTLQHKLLCVKSKFDVAFVCERM